MNLERTIVAGLVLLLGALWMGFVWHSSPRFPGSLTGGILGIAAALLMLIPLVYTCIKRIEWLNRQVTPRFSMSAWLTWHVYAGILGAILAILHTAHHFQSWLGILLTASMLLSVISGYLGRYFLRFLSSDLQERKQNLAVLYESYERLAETAGRPSSAASGQIAPQIDSGIAKELLHAQASELSEAIVDMEYAVQAEDVTKSRMSLWLSIHIVTSCTFYILLALHIAAGIQFGLRWLR
jgi:hypothetical protein